ncbi:MAG: PilZ domain-containing protein [Gammaproteobacteria bacterium]
MNVEKRRYPRVLTGLPADINNPDGLKLNVNVLETSIDGVRIQCNTVQRNMITPGGCFISGGRPIELSLNLYLPEGDVVSGRCQVAFSRRISKDRCELGLRYVELDVDSRNHLIVFIKKTTLAMAS